MKKKTDVLLIGLIILIIFSTYFLYDYQKETVQGTNLGLESVVGSALFKIWDNYYSIVTSESNELTIERVQDIHRKLLIIEAYSDIVDLAVYTELLSPIAHEMILITESMEESYEENNQFVKEDQSKYLTLIQEINALIPLIYKVYYVPESQEGAKVTLEINEFDEMIELNHKLQNYTRGLAK